MKGIILAGGSGTRLYPLTLAMSKQLLPVYDKPMIYYPLSTLMLAGIREILLITTPMDLPAFQRVLGDGGELGLDLQYAAQPHPQGIADAFRIGARFVGEEPVTLILGDNIFYGHGLSQLLQESVRDVTGCLVFGNTVADPQRYGVAETDADGQLRRIVEKPAEPPGSVAITGLYVYPNDVIEIARGIRPSQRGELEITDVNQVYIDQGRATLRLLGRGFAWLDAGTYDGLLGAAQFVQAVQDRQGIPIACLEEVAVRMGYIDADSCHALGAKQQNSRYGRYVMAVAQAEGVRA